MNYPQKSIFLYPLAVVFLSTLITFSISILSYIGITVAVFALYFGVFNALRLEVTHKTGSLFNYKDSILLGIPIIIGFCTFIVNVSNNKTVYLWDQIVYWNITNDFSDVIFNSIKSGYERLYQSIREDDYNVFPTISLLVWNKLIGNSYVSWSISVYLFCIVPAMLMLIFILHKFKSEGDSSPLNLLTITSWVVFYPQLTAAVTRGYLDGFGLLFISVLIYDFINDDLKKFDLKKSIWLALIVIFLLFTRRWYAFWVVGYFMASALTRIISFYIKEITKNQLKTALFQLAFTGITIFLILIVFFYEFVNNALFGQYKQVLIAWQMHSVSSMIMEIANYFGYFYISMGCLGIWSSIKNKDNRIITIFLLICTIITFILFTRVQSLGMHHLYLICPFVLIESFFGIKYLFNLIISERKSYLKSILISVLSLFFFGIAYSHTLYLKLPLMTKLVCPWSFSSQVRTDMNQLRDVIFHLNNINPSINNSTKGVYVLASSHEYNGQLFQNFNLPKRNAVNGLLATHEVDRRDGFPINFFKSDFIVVVDPIQFHLNPEEQTTIKYLAEQLLTKSGIGKSFEEINSIDMGNGKTIRIYKKVQKIELSDIEIFSVILKQRYPDMQNVFNFQTKNLIENIHTVGEFSSVNYSDDNKIYVHPGQNDASAFEVNTLNLYKTLKFKIISSDSVGTKNNCGQNGGEINVSVIADNDSILYKQYCTWESVQTCSIAINGFKKLKIEIEKGNNGIGCDGFILKDFELLP